MSRNIPVEVENLHQFIKAKRVQVSNSTAPVIASQLSPQTFTVMEKNCTVHVIDEYEDLEILSKDLTVVLILREFEGIEDSTDFLNWCIVEMFDASNDALRSYYIDMTRFLDTFKDLFDNRKVTSFVSDLDFQLNSGAAQYLRRNP